MSLTTNVMAVLADAQRARDEGSRTIINLINGGSITGLYVRYEEGYDYLIFDRSDETPVAEWREEYNAVGYLISENPKTGENALHIKISADSRKKLRQFYEDLCLNFDYSETDGSVWATINDYAHLWGKIRQERLSNEEEVGLFGELIVLKNLLEAGHSNALTFWKGPSDGLHDFVAEGNWELEVKTSLNPNPIVKVHPVTQLEPVDSPFHLIIVKLKNDKTNGTSLVEMIAEIESKLQTSGDKDKFESLLEEVGYFNTDSHKYTRKFVHLESLKYEISKDTETLCPLTIGSKAKYHSIRWTLLVSDYEMIECDSDFWHNPI